MDTADTVVTLQAEQVAMYRSGAKGVAWYTALGQGLWHSPRIRAGGCCCPLWQQALSEPDSVSLLLRDLTTGWLCVALTVCAAEYNCVRAYSKDTTDI